MARTTQVAHKKTGIFALFFSWKSGHRRLVCAGPLARSLKGPRGTHRQRRFELVPYGHLPSPVSLSITIGLNTSSTVIPVLGPWLRKSGPKALRAAKWQDLAAYRGQWRVLCGAKTRGAVHIRFGRLGSQ